MKRKTVARVVGIVWFTYLMLAMVPMAGAATSSSPFLFASPVLLAKSWLIGYAIMGLSILLGMLAVLIPSMRKVVRKKTT